jgi:hypothetical protein
MESFGFSSDPQTLAVYRLRTRLQLRLAISPVLVNYFYPNDLLSPTCISLVLFQSTPSNGLGQVGAWSTIRGIR